MPITSLTLERFRSFGRPQRFDFAPITILTGPNSSGKSSVTRALQLLQHTVQTGDLNRLVFEGGTHRLGSFARVLNRHDGDKTIRFEVELTDSRGDRFGIDFDYSPEGLSTAMWTEEGEEVAVMEPNDPSSIWGSSGTRLIIWPSLFARLRERGLTFNADESASSTRAEEGWVIEEDRSAPADEPIEQHLRRLADTETHDLDAITRQTLIPHLATRLATLRDALNSNAITTVGGDQAPPQRMYEHDSPLLLARLLRAYQEWVPGEWDAVTMEETTRTDEGLRLNEWLKAFGIGNGLDVERVSDVGFMAYVRRSSWRPRSEEAWYEAMTKRMGLDHDLASLHQDEDADAKTIAECKAQFPEVDEQIKAHEAEREREQQYLPPKGRLPLADLGYGYARVLPLLLHTALADANRLGTVIAEEPEANLHPDLQSKLADVFADLASRGGRALVETHSEYLIRKLQYLVATRKLPSEDVVIYYLGPDPDAEDYVRKITLDERGALSQPFGPGFLDEATSLMADLFRFESATDVVPFTTYLDFGALEAFVAAQPDPFADPKGNRRWATALDFLTGHTNVALDLPRDEIERLIRSGHQAICHLFAQRVQGVERFGLADAPKPTHPWRLHVERSPRTRSGVLTTDAVAFPAAVTRLRDGRSVRLHKNDPLPAELAALTAPTCGLIYVDPHLLARGNAGFQRSLAPLLSALLPEGAGPVPILLLSGTVAREGRAPRPEWGCPHLGRFFGGDVARARDAAERALRDARPDLDVRVGLVVNPALVHDYHDRHVFTRYFEIHAGRSADRLLDGGRVSYDTTFDGRSVLTRERQASTAAQIRRLHDIVRATPSEGIAGSAEHPLFAVLDPVTPPSTRA